MNNITTGLSVANVLWQGLIALGPVDGNSNLSISSIAVTMLFALGALLSIQATWKYRAAILHPENPAKIVKNYFETNAKGLSWGECKRKIEIALSFGASIDAQDRDGNTALHHIVSRDQVCKELLDFILSKTSNLSIRNHRGETPLHLAVKNDCPFIAPLITNENVNLQDEFGRTPFHLSFKRYDFHFNSKLLTKKNVHLRDFHGETPLAYALAALKRKFIILEVVPKTPTENIMELLNAIEAMCNYDIEEIDLVYEQLQIIRRMAMQIAVNSVKTKLEQVFQKVESNSLTKSRTAFGALLHRYF